MESSGKIFNIFKKNKSKGFKEPEALGDLGSLEEEYKENAFNWNDKVVIKSPDKVVKKEEKQLYRSNSHRFVKKEKEERPPDLYRSSSYHFMNDEKNLTRSSSFHIKEDELKRTNLEGGGSFGRVFGCEVDPKAIKLDDSLKQIATAVKNQIAHALKTRNFVVKYSKNGSLDPLEVKGIIALNEIYQIRENNLGFANFKNKLLHKVDKVLRLINLPVILRIQRNNGEEVVTAIMVKAKHSSVKDWLKKLNINTASRLRISQIESDYDAQAMKYFLLHPAQSLYVCARAMRQSLDCFQKVFHSVHRDIAPRNFLLCEWTKKHFIFEKNKITGVQSAHTQLSDFGTVSFYKKMNEIFTLSPDEVAPKHWSEGQSLKGGKVSIMSDWYSFRLTLISMIGLILGFEEDALIRIDEKISQDKEAKKEKFNNPEKMKFLVSNVEKIILKTRKEALALEDHTKDKECKLAITRGLLIFLNACKPYIFSMPDTTAPDFDPEKSKILDDNIFSLIDVNKLEIEIDKSLPNIDKKLTDSNDQGGLENEPKDDLYDPYLVAFDELATATSSLSDIPKDVIKENIEEDFDELILDEDEKIIEETPYINQDGELIDAEELTQNIVDVLNLPISSLQSTQRLKNNF